MDGSRSIDGSIEIKHIEFDSDVILKFKARPFNV